MILVGGRLICAAEAAGHGIIRFGTSGQGEGIVVVGLEEQLARHGELASWQVGDWVRRFEATMHTL